MLYYNKLTVLEGMKSIFWKRKKCWDRIRQCNNCMERKSCSVNYNISILTHKVGKGFMQDFPLKCDVLLKIKG